MTNHLMMTEASDISSLEQKVVKEIKKEDKFMWAQYVEQKIGADQDEIGDKSKETVPDSKLQQGRPDSLSTLGDLLAAEVKKQGKLETMRIPLNQFPAPSNASLEAMVKLLKGTGSAVPVIVSDQGGKCRAATGSAVPVIVSDQGGKCRA